MTDKQSQINTVTKTITQQAKSSKKSHKNDYTTSQKLEEESINLNKVKN
jgi:hypothetical protein